MAGKPCPQCLEDLPDSAYNYRKTGRQAGKRITPCKSCIKAGARGSRIKFMYGMTLEEHERILMEQGGGCAICGTVDPGHQDWATDHDHACCPGKKSCGNCVRGLLCSRCNVGLGMFEDDVERLMSAIIYLENR